MKKDDLFYSDMQQFIAVTTIGPSSLRNQGSKDVIKEARNQLSAIDLNRFSVEEETNFLGALEEETEKLRHALPIGARHWGAARKALNLFLRDSFYNRFLCKRYRLSKTEEWLEIPLDSLIADRLKQEAKKIDIQLPRWKGLIGLTKDDSSIFQGFAKQLASSERISRVHLDMRLWIEERDKTANKPLHRIAALSGHSR